MSLLCVLRLRIEAIRYFGKTLRVPTNSSNLCMTNSNNRIGSPAVHSNLMAAHITTKVDLFVQVRQSLRTVVDKINTARSSEWFIL
jgi:hypothetical protein